MKPEKIMSALNDIDGQFIMEGRQRTAAPRKTPRRIAVLIAAVIAVMAVSITAFASEEIAGLFRSFFAQRSEENLTSEQIEFIDENEQTIAETQIQEDYTLELKSAITDGTMAYIILGITGPEDAILNKTVIEGYNPDAPSISFSNLESDFLKPKNGKWLGSMSFMSEEDHDGRDNTQNLVFEILPSAGPEGNAFFSSGTVWTLHIEDLIATYRNEAYRKELEEKYPGTNVLLDDDEGALLYPEVILAEGVWDFEITFGDSDCREIELLDAPITTLACTGWKADGTDVYEEVTVSSFVLRSLSASIMHNGQGVDFSNNYDRLIFAVMEDGSQIRLINISGVPGETKLIAETPIILDNVDHILLADGTKLMVP